MKARLHNVTPAGRIIGYRKPRAGEVGPQPIHLIAGGAKDDDFDTDIGGGDDKDDKEDDEDEDDEDDEDDDKKDDDKKDEYVPPSKEEWERVKATAARRLKEKRELRTKLNAAKGNTGRRGNDKKSDGKDDKKDDASNEEAEAARRELAEEKKEAERWKRSAIRGEAKSALSEAGAKPSRVRALAKLLDYDDLDLDSDGEIEGIEEQIDELKDEYPEFFLSDDEDDKKGGQEDKASSTRRAAASRRARADAKDKGGSGKKELTGPEKIAASLLGRPV